MAEKCKNCGKELPANSTGKLCGYCLQKRKDNVKKAVASVFVVAAGVAFAIFSPSTGKEIIKSAKDIGHI